MSRRSRPIKVRLHVHCESCYSRRCRARVEPSVSCALKACRLLCGAVFHLCKEEEHSLLCPNERVPCLNAQYGCPLAVTRAGRAAHLRTCRASVVCCSMAWLRWPADDTDPHHQTTLQEKVLEAGGDPGQGGALDLCMALADQSDLYHRLKMKPLFPELMEEEEEQVEEEEEQVELGRRETANQAAVTGSEESSEEGTDSKGAEGQRSCAAGVNKERRDLCEMMFSMEKGGCTAAQAAAQSARREEAKTSRGGGGNETVGKDVADGPAPDHGKTGLAPWQAGVLERLKVELTPQEYNMYLVHHGRMLLSFGQIDACTPRERDFVYGSLEPIPVQTLHSFKVPVSYRHKRREKMYDTIARVQSETTAVDTSDLAVTEEDWQSDEAEATLLGYAELEVMGHKISEAKGTDGLYVDEGTQTHSFRTAPFTRNATLSEVTPERPAKLRLQLRSESVSSRHNMATSVFTFMCGHSFHRTELPTHFRNVHSDIQTCVSGWFEQRCPLAYLGCTYSQRRFQPSTHEATVTYNQQMRCFNLRPTINPGEGSPTDPPTAQRKRRGGGEDSLSTLPHEVLRHVASFLDSLSLSQLALVSRLLRDVCSSLLQDRGMVSLRWEKICSHGGAKWRATPVWEFSHLFSVVDSWRFADVPPISAHLKVCPFYTPTLSQQPVPLPSMREKHGGTAERQSLVDQFTANRHNN